MRRAVFAIALVALLVGCPGKRADDDTPRADPESKPSSSVVAPAASSVVAVPDPSADAGDTFGYGGLGLSSGSIDGDAGGWGEGIGLGSIGGFGGSGDAGGGKSSPKSKITDVGLVVDGKLPPEVVRRILRANFPRFRACYEHGLKTTPTLAGTVSVKMIVDSTGAVESVTSIGGTLVDAGVVRCVVGVYQTLSFPEPESGKVTVTQPLAFSASKK